jgi:hypothetical protein
MIGNKPALRTAGLLGPINYDLGARRLNSTLRLTLFCLTRSQLDGVCIFVSASR